MKTLVTSLAICTAMAISGIAQAGQPSKNTLSAMGFGSMKKVSDKDGMSIRGKGNDGYGYTFTPFVISHKQEVVHQFASANSFNLSVSLQKTAVVQKAFAARSEFLFIGPKLPGSYGNYGGHIGGGHSH